MDVAPAACLVELSRNSEQGLAAMYEIVVAPLIALAASGPAQAQTPPRADASNAPSSSTVAELAPRLAGGNWIYLECKLESAAFRSIGFRPSGIQFLAIRSDATKVAHFAYWNVENQGWEYPISVLTTSDVDKYETPTSISIDKNWISVDQKNGRWIKLGVKINRNTGTFEAYESIESVSPGISSTYRVQSGACKAGFPTKIKKQF